MTVLEAMACGTPVVATKLGGIRHVLSDGEDSLLVDPSVPEELGGAILKLLSNEELARSIADRGFQLIRERFSWESIARQTLDFYGRHV
jgi:glycosyltransferase involved in cell wall biosynthesis